MKRLFIIIGIGVIVGAGLFYPFFTIKNKDCYLAYMPHECGQFPGDGLYSKKSLYKIIHSNLFSEQQYD